ncbi:MAG: universal stress protein [Endozoicomonadaceae bacterium]|nr:universal stress protein [Endozoicomonadaceae bacterium]
MGIYKHILVAIDLSDEATVVLEKAKEIASFNNAKLTIVHVIEPLNIAYGSDIPLNATSFEKEITEHAVQRLSFLSEKMQVSDEEKHVIYGKPEKEVHRIAKNNEIDLIVVGSHGRHGLALILGSTSTSILHGACCDVLAVRVGKK